MDPQNSSPDYIFCRDLKVLLRQSFNFYCKSLLQHAVVCRDPQPCAPSKIQSRESFLGRDSILFFNIFILSLQSFLYRDKSFFGSLTICPARSFVLSILCHDNLMCDYWNSYVVTLTIVSQQCLCVAFSNWCGDTVCMSR